MSTPRGERVTSPVDDTLQQIAQAGIYLEEAIETAEEFDADDYTVDSYASLFSVIKNGKTELVEEHITATDFDRLNNCIKSIADAEDTLVGCNYIINESFDTLNQETYRAVLAATGWSFEETNGVVTLEKDGENNYLKIEQTSKTSSVVGARWTHPMGLSGKVYVEVKVRSDAGSTPFCAPFLYGTETVNGDNILCGVQLRENNKISSSFQKGSLSTKQVGTFAQGQWNTICLVMDTQTYGVQVYVNGVRKDDGTYVLRNNLPVLKMIRLYSDDKTAANSPALAYVDNVRIYQAATATH